MFRETILAHIPTLKQISNATVFLNFNTFICEMFLLVKYFKIYFKNIWKITDKQMFKKSSNDYPFWEGGTKIGTLSPRVCEG